MDYESNELQDFELLKFQCGKDLHPVFSTVLDTFPDITGATVHGQIYLWDVLQTIKYNLGFDIDADAFLTPKYIDGKKNTVYDNLKAGLPAICYNARFNGYKNVANCKTINNLMFLDIDDFNSKLEALEYKTMIIAKYDWILACNLSLSKVGLHIVIMVDKIIDNDDFNYKYDYISTTYFDGKLDKTSKSLTRYTVVPYDFNIYINEHPTPLDIESIIRSNEKGIRSVNKEIESVGSSSYNKGICSAYIKDGIVSDFVIEKGICSGDEKEIICTAYTFAPEIPLREILNNAARQDGLRFRPEVDEALITDPDIPLYFHEGIDVISINLFPYRDQKVFDGRRTKFLGALTVQMIYLNVELPEYVDHEVRRDIFRFIQSINKKICAPPLPFKEVLNSFNAHWIKYEAGKMIFSRYFKKQRAFWSANSNLKGNEKRKVTCRIKNEPIVAESRRKIGEAIDTLYSSGIKATQKKVVEKSGLKLPTVKKYWKEYKEMVRQSNALISNKCVAAPQNSKAISTQKAATESTSISDKLTPNLNSDAMKNVCSEPKIEMEFENPQDIIFELDTKFKNEEIEFAVSDEQITIIYNRIFSSIISRLDEHQEQELHTKFVNRLNGLPQDDLRILCVNIEDINDSNTFWKQSALDGKFWDLCDELFSADINRNTGL